MEYCVFVLFVHVIDGRFDSNLITIFGCVDDKKK